MGNVVQLHKKVSRKCSFQNRIRYLQQAIAVFEQAGRTDLALVAKEELQTQVDILALLGDLKRQR